MEITFKPIGIIHSCFKEKFGIPRQPGLVPLATAELALLPPFDREEALTGLDDFSHVWVFFLFHANPDREWKPTVRPPRLGGNRRLGVFATRSGFRPNPIGLSAVELLGIEKRGKKLLLRLGGVDLMDGTPVLDIKPYLPYSDRLAGATGGFAPAPPETDFHVVFSEDSENVLAEKESEGLSDLTALVTEILKGDPRPAYYRDKPTDRTFAMNIHGLNIRWKTEGDVIRVLSVDPIL